MSSFLFKLITKISSYLGRESASYILYLPANPSKNSNEESESFILTADVANVEKSIGSLRIENKNHKQWLENGSLLCVANNSKIKELPRGWMHFSGVRKVSLFTITLKNNTAWLGPDFVPITFRGKKYHYKLIQERIKLSTKNNSVEAYFTGVNIGNVPSLKNYMANGFQVVGILRSRCFLFFHIKDKLLYSGIVGKYMDIV